MEFEARTSSAAVSLPRALTSSTDSSAQTITVVQHIVVNKKQTSNKVNCCSNQQEYEADNEDCEKSAENWVRVFIENLVITGFDWRRRLDVNISDIHLANERTAVRLLSMTCDR